ncbi:hypothetical protein [Marinobacterium lutimaris]|uniref:Uncharacterized protein n=1 Tax=Marinobacterium lutimaris TaxID=568106 RepID=A0A1H5XUF3_9GAMM|nr:hypothetical protein [Marinobacterium lutimaris]SEG15409.1 hypothetical protein SAMN05444390_1011510 [Marinobacterium lutimaris]
MSSKRKVTERDLRMPEFRDADLEDLEFRDDGQLVRKDRWERGIRRIAGVFGINHSFEIDEVVNSVRLLVDQVSHWESVEDTDWEDIPTGLKAVDIMAFDGSVLMGATYLPDSDVWRWCDMPVFNRSEVEYWRGTRMKNADEVESV